MTRREEAEELIAEFQQILEESEETKDPAEMHRLEAEGLRKLAALAGHLLLDFIYGVDNGIRKHHSRDRSPGSQSEFAICEGGVPQAGGDDHRGGGDGPGIHESPVRTAPANIDQI